MVIAVRFYLLRIFLQCVNDKVEKVFKRLFADTNNTFVLMSDTRMSRSYESLRVNTYITYIGMYNSTVQTSLFRKFYRLSGSSSARSGHWE